MTLKLFGGGVGILNVGAGDTKLSFDPSNPQECIRAARIVKDMLRRGYALLVDSGEKTGDGKPIYRRALEFDETKYEYVIADFDPVTAAVSDAAENGGASDGIESPAKASAQAPGAESRWRGRTRRV